MPVLSAEELEHFDREGWVVAKGVISPDQAARTAEDVWEFASRPEHEQLDFYLHPTPTPHAAHERWYDASGKMAQGGFKKAVELYHSQAQWDNLTCPRMHELFTQLYQTPRLVAGQARFSITPPSRDSEEEQGFHWDLAPLYEYLHCTVPGHEARAPSPAARSVRDGVGTLPPFAIAAVLYLTDTPAEAGGFTCIPRFHRRIEHWLGTLPPNTDPKLQDLASLSPGPVSAGGQAGDVVLWNSLLPHGAGVNRTPHSRVVQYVGLHPADDWSMSGGKHGHAAQEARAALQRWHAERTGSPRLKLPNERGQPLVWRYRTGRMIAGLEAWDGEAVPPPSDHLLPGSTTFCRPVSKPSL
jgi:hypothetical protein